MTNLPEMTLETLAGGAAGELFLHELERVAENILDVNTEADAVRSITLKVTIKPGDERGSAGVTVTCASKLGPQKGAATTMFLGRRIGGKPIVTQFDQKQMQLAFDKETKPTLAAVGPGEVVNTQTGEITKSNPNPIDGKAAAAGE